MKTGSTLHTNVSQTKIDSIGKLNCYLTNINNVQVSTEDKITHDDFKKNEPWTPIHDKASIMM